MQKLTKEGIIPSVPSGKEVSLKGLLWKWHLSLDLAEWDGIPQRQILRENSKASGCLAHRPWVVQGPDYLWNMDLSVASTLWVVEKAGRQGQNKRFLLEQSEKNEFSIPGYGERVGNFKPIDDTF